MATSITQSLLNSTSTSIPIRTLKKSHESQSLSKFSQKPITLSPLKKICKHGGLKEAFVSLSNILTNQNPPHSCLDEAYSLVLDLCSRQKSLPQVRQIHTLVLKSIASHDIAFLSTKLVFAYGKCGSIFDAEKVFDKMCERTVFTWNAMIGAFLTNGEPLGALEVFWEMHVLGGVQADASTFTSILKVCGELEDRCLGIEFHCLAIKLGFLSNVFVTNSLMGMYAKYNDSNSAMLLFGRMSEKDDVVSWNSIISAYSTNGHYAEALKLFREMLIAGVVPSTYTFVATLQACEESCFEVFGKEIHAFVLKSFDYLDMYVANALVVMYTKSGKMGEASKIFNAMDEKDYISWNSMLSGFVQNGLYNEAVDIFHKMQISGHKPDQCSLISMITTFGRLGNLLKGMEIHAYAMKHGMYSNLQVGNTLIDMYAKCCKMNYAELVFDKIPCKDYISWTTIIAGCAQNNFHSRAIKLFQEAQMKGIKSDSMMIGSILACNSHVKEIHGYIMRNGLSDLVLQNTLINAYGKCGCVDNASRVFELIKVKDVVSWTSMVCSFVHNGLANEALDFFISMKETGIEPDSIALVTILSAVSDLSSLTKGKEIHGFLVRKGFILQGPIASSLVDMYACCGTIESSYKVFNSIEEKDLVLWTSMINAYGMHGCGKTAINLFRRMEVEKIRPDHVSFLAILYACSHSSLVIEGKAFFEAMKYEYGLEPWAEHYACLVDLFGRANNLEEAFQFVESMEIEPNAAIWCSLLNSCRIHSNKELGNFAARKILELDSENPGNFVLVSNFYAMSGRWLDLKDIRLRMRGKGLKKDPACSWTEIGNKVHIFTARDRSHPESEEIYKKLSQIIETLERLGGYVAETKNVLHNVEETEKVKTLYGHSERLAIAYGILKAPKGTPIRITKNLRVCDDCHTFSKLVSKYFEREIIVRDANRFHHFGSGVCSCGDFW